MKCILIHAEVDGGTSRVPCFGKDEKALNDDISHTMKVLNWNPKYCSTVEEDW